MPGLVQAYASTLFLTSGLLFLLEPVVAKGLLPVLGGGASVWATAVAFFQVALLAGYLYAHLLPRWAGERRHRALHLALFAGAAIALPFRAPAGWRPWDDHPALWLFGRLAVSVGPSFVLLAATTPLLHRWLSSSGDRRGRDPYFLYAASNAGSLIALLAYPVLVEPTWGLDRQRQLWRAGFALAALALAACALLVRRATVSAPVAGDRDPTVPGVRPTPARTADRLRWVALAGVPSSLLLSVTNHVTTDVVALPLLWVVPLALYLLTFILAFAYPPERLLPPSLRAQPFLLLPVAAEMFLRTDAAAWALLPLHLVTFTVCALVCHARLADSRPPADRSTEFYLWIAVGGALGGLVNVFVAPAIFSRVLEYPLGLVAAALLRPASGLDRDGARRRLFRADLLLPAAVAAVLLGGGWVAGRLEGSSQAAGVAALIALLSIAGVATHAFRDRPVRFGLGLAAMMAAGAAYARGGERPIHTARSFYGVHEVRTQRPSSRALVHGNTIHGAQDLARRGEPLTYYHRLGPVAAVVETIRGRPARIGVAGLGVGSLAAYAGAGQRWTFLEIDPEVIAIAQDPNLFTFLADARGRGADVAVVPGDARISLAALRDGELELLFLDAFTSDAVPAHLLTREALALYFRKLAPGGLAALHLSNRHLDLEPVVAAAAADLGLAALARFDPASPEEERLGKSPSQWMVLARTSQALAPVAARGGWQAPRLGRPWTDDATNLWSALRIFR